MPEPGLQIATLANLAAVNTFITTNGVRPVRTLWQNPNFLLIYEDLGNLLASTTLQPDGTYDYYIDMRGFHTITLQIADTAGTGLNTYTVWTSQQDDSTLPTAIADWQDDTNSLFGVASFTASTVQKAADLSVAFLRVRVVRTLDPAPGAGGWVIRTTKA